MKLSENEIKIIYILGKDIVVNWNDYSIFEQRYLSSKKIMQELKLNYVPYKNINSLRKKKIVLKQGKTYGLSYNGAKIHKKLKPSFRLKEFKDSFNPKNTVLFNIKLAKKEYPTIYRSMIELESLEDLDLDPNVKFRIEKDRLDKSEMFLKKLVNKTVYDVLKTKQIKHDNGKLIRKIDDYELEEKALTAFCAGEMNIQTMIEEKYKYGDEAESLLDLFMESYGTYDD